MKYYLVCQEGNGDFFQDDVLAYCSDIYTAEKIIDQLLEENPQGLYYTKGKTDKEMRDNDDKDFIFICEVEANAAHPVFFQKKCYVLTQPIDMPLRDRVIAVCTARARAEQIKEELIEHHKNSKYYSGMYDNLWIEERYLFSGGATGIENEEGIYNGRTYNEDCAAGNDDKDSE